MTAMLKSNVSSTFASVKYGLAFGVALAEVVAAEVAV
jgi:hypothetical protein